MIIGQSETSAAELLLQDAVLLDEVGNDLCLLTVDPTGAGGEEQLKREVGHLRPMIAFQRATRKFLSRRPIDF